MMTMSGPAEKKRLKRGFRSRAGAMGALTRATATSNVTHFREEILSCWILDSSVHTFPTLIYKDDFDVQGAQQVLGEGRSWTPVSCGNEGCEKTGPRYKDIEGYFRHCPCKTVYYCSKECQNVHWQSHKAVCPWHLDKKAKAKEEKKKSHKSKKSSS